MKLLTLLAVFLACLVTTRADVATELSALKAAFPEYRGQAASNDKHNITDPAVKEIIAKYTKTAASLTPANLKGNIGYLRTQLERDIKTNEEIMATSERSPSTKQAYYNARSNAYWLKKKVSPWVDKLDALVAK